MRNGIRVGRLFGINIFLDWSWLFIFLLVAWNLGAAVFPSLHPEWSTWLNWTLGIIAAAAFFGSVLAHELAHSIVARARGLPVRNIVLFIFGGVSNIEREPPSPGVEFWMAIVGPLTSFALGVVFLVLGALLAGGQTLNLGAGMQSLAGVGPAATLLLYLGPINLLLGFFNMIPGFPLDGGRVLRSILWALTDNLRRATRWASLVGQGIAWLFIVAGVAMIFGVQIPFFGQGLVGGLWLAFIGWFLNSAAVQTYRQVVIEDMLEGVPVTRLMQREPARVQPDLTIEMLVDHHMLGGDERSFLVLSEAGQVAGLVSLEDVRKIPRERWPATRVKDIMTPLTGLATISPAADASEALHLMSRRDVRQLPVVQDGQLVGSIRRQDILRWLQLQSDLAKS